MTYPRTLLTRRIRRTIMAAGITLFFIVAPLVILYTAGYRYNPDTRQVEQTGVLSIDIEPRDVRVFLNGVRMNKKIPIRLPNRAPGTYHLSIRKDGYHPWEQDITIGSKQTTYVKGVALFRDANPAPAPIPAPQQIDTMEASEDGSALLWTRKENTMTTVEMLDATTGRTAPIKRARDAPLVFWSPWYGMALIVSQRDGKTVAELFDPNDEKIVQTATLPPGSKEIIIEWQEERDTSAVFLQKDNQIIRMGRNGTTVVGEIERGMIWYVDADFGVWTYNQETNELALRDETRDDVYAPPQLLTALIHVNKHRIIGKTREGVLVLPRESSSAPVSNLRTQNLRANPATGEWYAWSQNELWSIYTDGRAALLNRTGEKIISVHPLDPYGALLLSTETSLLAFNPGYNVTQELFSGGRIDAVSVNQKLRRIHFLGEIDGQKNLFELAY